MDYKAISFISLIVAGFFFTVERVSAVIARGIAAQGKSGFDLTPSYPGIFDNLFVVFFILLAVILLIYDYILKNKKNDSK
ncbi:hypothetical protein [Paenibacillus silvae]|uniref:Uncharacterized protein n=1 Tax=Paenibacillus silvae TaxID=1325358 RepID=A0A2W6N8M7_9BACL|nr:hypothetical protein [Paenibacillus silvae]MCK6077703.1 hypothetical protein [Paenibacillus silvae]MCK6270587.1 hypothetical protein [Paenibacillus silvae]PZT52295.1 hypothetical protein DN757_28175 [Paenibacillus silvae]